MAHFCEKKSSILRSGLQFWPLGILIWSLVGFHTSRPSPSSTPQPSQSSKLPQQRQFLPTESGTPTDLWKVTHRLKLPRGPYQWDYHKRYGLVGHISDGRVTLVDTQSWKILGTKTWGLGQVYTNLQGKWGLVSLTPERRLLLVSLPAMQIIRSYVVPFYPYGVSFVQDKVPATGTPSEAVPLQHALVADQMGGRLLLWDLQQGKAVRVEKTKWPLSVRWSPQGILLIPITGAPQWLHPQTWIPSQTWTFPEVAGDVAVLQNTVAVAYGDSKNKPGTLHVYGDLGKQVVWRVSTAPRPRGVALTQHDALILTESGRLQVFSRKHGKLRQQISLGNNGLLLRCVGLRDCSALLPLTQELIRLQSVAPVTK